MAAKTTMTAMTLNMAIVIPAAAAVLLIGICFLQQNDGR